MQLGWFVKLKSVSYSLFLHAVAVILLVISFDFTDPIKPHHQNINIVNAVTVDQAQVEKELQRLKQEDDKQKQAEKQRLAELEKKAEAEKKKAEEIKKQRQEEEKKLAETRKKKEQEQKQREEEQEKVAELEKQKEELEAQRKLEVEAKKKKDAEVKKQEEDQRKAEAEKLLQEQMAEEEAKLQAESDKKLISSLGDEIHNKIASYFNLTGLPEGLSCKLRVNLLPDGEVINAAIITSSGNEIFDRRALTAVQKASPLPVPKDADTFERLNMRETTITFEP